MKNRIKYLAIAALLFVTACSQTQESALYKPNKDDAKEIHFIQSSIEKEFAQSAKSGVIYVEIARPGNKGRHTIDLVNTGDNAELFDAPSQVVFEEGQHSVKVPVQIDLSNFVIGSNYKTELFIKGRDTVLGEEGAEISQYTDKVALSATFELEWEFLYRTTASGETIKQTATYHYTQFYTGADKELEVEKAIGANIYRLNNWASGVFFKFILHKDNTCTVPAQSIGYYNAVYNEYVYVSDMAVYQKNDAAYASYPCTFDEQTGTFSFSLIYYVSAGYFNQGVETLVFDSEPDTSGSVEISYQGITTTETGISAPKISFSPNTHTKYYKATIVEGDLTDNAPLIAEARQNLIDDTAFGTIPIVTYTEASESLWNIPKGNYTAIALPYNDKDVPGDLSVQRFTCDPLDEYSIKISNFKFFVPTDNPLYSPYNTFAWEMQASNVIAARYLCVLTKVIEPLTKQTGMSIEELTEAMGTDFGDGLVEVLVSEKGFATAFTPMAQGTEYTLCVVLMNKYGDKSFVSAASKTAGRYAKDFDQTKTFADFTGSFSAIATVSKADVKYRIDITPVNDTEVIIKGMSDMRDFAPELRGYYDKDRHMLYIEPQPAGRYDSNTAVLGMYDGLSLYWGSAGMAIGYIGDTLYWTSSPYYSYDITGYMFLLFDSADASSGSYLQKYVGDKIYTGIHMTRLQNTATASVREPVANTRNISMPTYGDQPIKTFDNSVNAPIVLHEISGFIERPSTSKNVAPRSTRPANGAKTLRTDLTLQHN